jgi:radical SAM-linked protein
MFGREGGAMKRLLVKFSKKSEAAFLSHRETMRCLEKALRRSDLPMSYTTGYSPHPRISYSPALPLGVAAEAEYIEVAVVEEVDADVVRERINMALPGGLRVSEIQPLGQTMPRLSRWTRYGLYRVPSESGDVNLLLSMSGEKQGRLKDALEKMASVTGLALRDSEVIRVGLYASRDEVYEEAAGSVYYYDGETGDLMEGFNEDTGDGR